MLTFKFETHQTGPLIKTYHDFWRCVWHNKTLVIVMTTRTTERGKMKCGQYWPLEVKTYCTIGNFCIINDTVEQEEDWVITHLKLLNTDTNEKRTVVHMIFNSWPDFGAFVYFLFLVANFELMFLLPCPQACHNLLWRCWSFVKRFENVKNNNWNASNGMAIHSGHRSLCTARRASEGLVSSCC